MAHVCPWWFVRSFDNPLRRVFHKPERIFEPWVRPGMHVADIGCGAGFNTEALAQLVGAAGSVVGVDLQPRMLAMTKRRLERSGLLARVELIQATEDDLRLGSSSRFQFAVAFWMVHEVPDVERLLIQVRDALEPGGSLLVSEPKIHVSPRAFEASIRAALGVGFVERDRPQISLSRSVLLDRP